jgi:hypothetical protein
MVMESDSHYQTRNCPGTLETSLEQHDNILQPTASETPPINNIYEALPLPTKSKCIRLLDLHPATDDQQLQGTLRLASLDDMPNFCALSYVWGTFSIPRHKIDCGSQTLELTTNCWSALYHLRKLYGQMTIWVDSICIDQSKEHERNHQVDLMGLIYSSAKTVYAWLGDENDRTNEAMESLLRVPFIPESVEDGANSSTIHRFLRSGRSWARHGTCLYLWRIQS